MKRVFRNQSGAILITYALLLTALLGFIALGVEAGRWYLVRSELSKSVDAAAMAGAKNISNPNVDPRTIAEEVGKENFPAGRFGTAAAGEGSISFIPSFLGTKFQVVGKVSALSILGQVFGIHQVLTSSSGVAQIKEVEIMMVLDKSGSMSLDMPNLKNAAKSFLGFFEQTQDADKMGLITFATGVKLDHPISTHFVVPMSTVIDAMSASTGKSRFTNVEDAIKRSGDQFTDQSGVPPEDRILQYLIFFTDGKPNAFRDTFTYRDTVYDVVAYAENDDCTGFICGIDRFLCDPVTGNNVPVPAMPTGDGKLTNSSCGANVGTKWNVFAEYPVTGYGPESCRIPESSLKPIWFRSVATQKAIKHVDELKAKGIKIYVIGLLNVDESFLRDNVASGPEFYYYTPASDQLGEIFQTVAKEIKLRLVQ